MAGWYGNSSSSSGGGWYGGGAAKTATPKKSGGGGLLGKILAPEAHFVEHLGEDVKSSVEGIPMGLIETAKHPIGAAKQLGHAEWQTWSPLFHGHPGKFGQNVYAHPLAPLLDVATVFSLGLDAATLGAASPITGALMGARTAEGAARIAEFADEGSRLAKLAQLRTEKTITMKAPEGALDRGPVTLHLSPRPMRHLLQEVSLGADKHLPNWWSIARQQHRYTKALKVEAAHRIAATGAVQAHALQYLSILKAGKTLEDPAVRHDAFTNIASTIWQGQLEHAPHFAPDPALSELHLRPQKGEFSPQLKNLAAAYMDSAKLKFHPVTDYVEANPERGARIAKAYDAMKDINDPSASPAYRASVRKSYAAFAKETHDQYDALVSQGYKFEFMPKGHDPYGGSPWNSMRDIQRNQHMYVFPTDEGFGMAAQAGEHPLLKDTGVQWEQDGVLKPVTVNDMFRAVHDVFGHSKEGVGFRADGEENAWRSHAAMYSPLARKAMTTETRGQNSWVNFGPHGEANRAADQGGTVYAEQKVGLLPRWAVNEGSGITKTAMPAEVPPGHSFLIQHDALMAKIGHDWEAGDFENFLRNEGANGYGQMALTRDPKLAQRDGAGQFVVVPRHDKALRPVLNDGANSSRMVRWLWEKPTRMWKIGQVGYTFRTVANNGVGNWLIYSFRVSGNHALAGVYDAIRYTKGAKAARRMMSQPGVYDAENFRGFLQKHHLDEMSNTFSTAFRKDIGDAKTKYGQVLKQGIHPVVHKVSDQPVRAAAFGAFYRGHPEVRAFMKSQGVSMEKAADLAISNNPAIRAQASRYVRSIAGDYTTPSSALMRNIVPFYLWDRHALGSAKALLLEQPGRVAMAQQVSALGLNKTQADLGPLPEFLRGAVPFALPFMHETGDRKGILTTQSLNPFATVGDIAGAGESLLTGGGVNPGESITGQMNPLITSAIEYASGKSLLTGGDMPRHGGLPTSILANVIPQLPAVQVGQSLVAPKPSTTAKGNPTLYENKPSRYILSLLGVPFRQVSEGTANAMANLEAGKKAPSKRKRTNWYTG